MIVCFVTNQKTKLLGSFQCKLQCAYPNFSLDIKDLVYLNDEQILPIGQYKALKKDETFRVSNYSTSIKWKEGENNKEYKQLDFKELTIECKKLFDTVLRFETKFLSMRSDLSCKICYKQVR